MLPTNSVDRLYAEGIKRYCDAIGYEAAYYALDREYQRMEDATLRQAFHIDGALMGDIVEIAKQYPNWIVGFADTGGETQATLSSHGGANVDEANEIVSKIEKAFAKHNRIPGVPGVKDAFTWEIREVEGQSDV